MWSLAAALGMAAALLVVAPATATPQPEGSILIVAPHPDDDVITAAGIAHTASDVTVVYVTSGDACSGCTVSQVHDIARTRLGEAAAAQELLGQTTPDLIVLGYPDSWIQAMWDPAPFPNPEWNGGIDTTYVPSNVPGWAGVQTWYASRNGGAEAAYTWANLVADLTDIINTVRPDHIFTTAKDVLDNEDEIDDEEGDRSNDHRHTNRAVVSALNAVTQAPVGYHAVVHDAVVHSQEQVNSWPSKSDPSQPVSKLTGMTQATWDARESFEVPSVMQVPLTPDTWCSQNAPATNLKCDAILAHASQAGADGNFIQRFAHRDEVFWVHGPQGIGDSPPNVQEGGAATFIVIGNDVDWYTADNPALPALDDAVLLDAPAHGSVVRTTPGSFRYTHDGSENFSDSFTYRPLQGGFAGSAATVTLTVTPQNDAPVLSPIADRDTVAGEEVTFTAQATDPDLPPDVLTFSVVSGPGSIGSASGVYTWTPGDGDVGNHDVTVEVTDGALEDQESFTIDVASRPPDPVPSQLGLVDASQGRWHLYESTGLGLTALGDEIATFFYGNPGDFPIFGDWDCDGESTPGMYRQTDGFVYLRNSNTVGIADIRFFFGNPGDVPIVGDFNADGCDTVSIYRPSLARFFIINELGEDEGGLGAADFFYTFGNPGDKPFIGDFDGDGIDTAGLHRESTGFVYFRNSHTAGTADNQFFFGDPADRLVAGDWGIIDGIDTPAVYRPSTATFYFRFTNTAGNADATLTVGNGTWLPIAGTFGS